MAITQQYIDVAQQVANICEACGRNPEEVCLVAVSKTVTADKVQDAIDGGASHFGENRPEQIMEKHAMYSDSDWHFIGNVQSRRIKDIVPCASLIHSVYKQEHLSKIDAAARDAEKVQDILIEVNVSGEESKGGVTPEELPQMITQAVAFENIRVCGLMTMAPQGSIDVARDCFRGLRQLRDQINASGILPEGKSLSELSMGMSEDWQCAIEEGATIIRIGRAIFSEAFAR